MNKKRVILTILVAFLAMWHYSDGQAQRPVREQMRLAGVMPRGALVYVQARDLNGLMKAWLASGVRGQFYKSKSYAAFAKSRIYLKLQDRLNDFEKAVGFGLSEERLAEIAGGLSAISIYDIGKLEIALVTEVSREKAIATSLFKLVPQFEERATDGSSYFVREMTSDGGRLHQQFCFAHVGGKLIVTTTEGLMIRAIRNAKSSGDDALLADVMALADAARGFTPHEITMWLDQSSLNRNLYFNNYWIHRNVKELAKIESGLIDLRITPEGMTEQRWFRLEGQETGNRAIAGNQVSALLKFAPISSQLVEVHAQGATGDSLSASVSQTFFGKLPDASTQVYAGGYSNNYDGDGDNDNRPRAERYSRLDARFDMDVDDEQAMRSGQQAPTNRQRRPAEDDERFKKAIAAILNRVAPAAYCELARSKSDAASPFVRFERAVVIEMKSEASVDRAALERAIMDEMRARYVIAGIEPRLAWQEETGVRFLAQSLLEQGAAYSITGKYLVLSSSREFARDILQASAAQATVAAQRIDGEVETYALVRVADAKPVFDKLMSKLDGRTQIKDSTGGEEEEGTEEIKFFSENLSSLISASAIREMRIRRETAGSMIIERVVYSW